MEINNEFSMRIYPILKSRNPDKMIDSRPMDFTGKPMRGIVFIGPQGYKTTKTRSTWIDLELDYVSKLEK